MSYQVVVDFERALSEYTGAPYVVTTNSCSMALTLAVAWWVKQKRELSARIDDLQSLDRVKYTYMIGIPKNTYASVPMSIIHGGGYPAFTSRQWDGEYILQNTPVWDSARRFTSGMYRAEQMQCVSFQTSKILGLEQGGAILHDDAEADSWLRRARFDGRLDALEKLPRQIGFHAYLNPSTAALGLQHLACLPKHNEDNGGSYLFDDLSQLDIWK